MTPEEILLHELLFTVRGLKRSLYRHSTTVSPETGGVRLHRCKVCNRTSINDELIPHHSWCSLFRVQTTWKALKEAKPEMFDFSDKFTKKKADHDNSSPDRTSPTPASIDGGDAGVPQIV